jgi:hypothetical protein
MGATQEDQFLGLYSKGRLTKLRLGGTMDNKLTGIHQSHVHCGQKCFISNDVLSPFNFSRHKLIWVVLL